MTSSLPLPVLRQLLNEATGGEWLFRDETYEQERNGGAFVSANVVEGMWDIATCGAGSIPPYEGDRVELARANARLIAAMHTALPALLDLVDRQAAAIEAVQELAAWFDDQAEQNDETLRSSSPGAPWRDRHSGLRDAYANAADDLRTALSGITPTTEENPK